MITLKRLNVVRKVATAQPPKKGKGSKGDDKEGRDGGTDQPGSGDGAE